MFIVKVDDKYLEWDSYYSRATIRSKPAFYTSKESAQYALLNARDQARSGYEQQERVCIERADEAERIEKLIARRAEKIVSLVDQPYGKVVGEIRKLEDQIAKLREKCTRILNEAAYADRQACTQRRRFKTLESAVVVGI